jgi:hypothetical protein
VRTPLSSLAISCLAVSACVPSLPAAPPPETPMAKESALVSSPSLSAPSQVRPRLRSVPGTLTMQEAKIAVVVDGLHCAVWNETAHVVEHDYERKTLESVVVVLDRTFQLMWQDSDVPRAAKTSRRVTREGAFTYVAQLNAAGFAGFHDWRVPTIDEAMSLMTDAAGGTKPASRRGWQTVDALPVDNHPGDPVIVHLSPVFDWSVALLTWTSDLSASDDPKSLSRAGLGIVAMAWVVDYANAEPNAEDVGNELPVRAVRSL